MLSALFATGIVFFVILASAKWGVKVLLVVAAVAIVGGAGRAMAQERCYIEALPGGKSSCFLPSNNTTFICEGQDKRRTSICNSPDGEPAQCELRPTRLNEPPDIWCSMPSPAPGSGISVSATGSHGPRDARAYQQSETTKPPKQTPQSLCTEFEKTVFYGECIAKMKAGMAGIGPPKQTVCRINYFGASARMTCE